MGDFKGTKEKWSVRHLPQTEYISETNEINYGEDGECIAEYVHNKYDALLISKAPEMLLKLKQCINAITSSGFGESENRYRPYIGQAFVDSIEKLINEATEL